MDRNEFLNSVVKLGLGTCCCGLAGAFNNSLAQDTAVIDSTSLSKPNPAAERALKRIEFTDQWVTRLFDIIDEQLDEPARKKLMMANGRACYLNWIRETGQKIPSITLEEMTEKVKNNPNNKSIRIEGNTIYFAYMSSAETGDAAKAGECLCTLVESKPKGLSPTYCNCSLGYVKEMFSLRLNRPVEVELLESVLAGGDFCRFKITVL